MNIYPSNEGCVNTPPFYMGSRNPVRKRWNPVELQFRHVEIGCMTMSLEEQTEKGDSRDSRASWIDNWDLSNVLGVADFKHLGFQPFRDKI